jgi:hypothetical protein
MRSREAKTILKHENRGFATIALFCRKPLRVGDCSDFKRLARACQWWNNEHWMVGAQFSAVQVSHHLGYKTPDACFSFLKLFTRDYRATHLVKAAFFTGGGKPSIVWFVYYLTDFTDDR